MFILEEGKPIDSYYMLHAIGIFQSEEEIKNSPYQTAATKPGYLKFEDTNGDGKITEDDRQIRGGVIPKITYGFNINLGYKDWDLSAFFQGVTDVYTYGDRIGATPLWFGCGLPEQCFPAHNYPRLTISCKIRTAEFTSVISFTIMLRRPFCSRRLHTLGYFAI